jgi:glycerate 2-kinase
MVSIPVADGGDGTVDAACAAGFDRVPIRVDGPSGVPVETSFARRDKHAVVELAATCGLSLVPGGRLDALGASSFGVGEALRAALDAGCRRIVLGIGGSASTDGGAGMVSALGARLLDADGAELARGGAALAQLDQLDLSDLHPAVGAAEIVVACDVDNPLLGPTGAAAVYGPQKGASAADVRTLEDALARWAGAVSQATATDHADDPGAGAAGGVGFAAIAILGARLAPGIDLLLDLVGFHDALRDADLVVTGEGSLDEQTLNGKAPAGVAAAARASGITTVAVAGRVLLTPQRLAAAGISQAYALSDLEPDAAKSMSAAGPLLDELARELAQDWIVRT